MSTVNQSTVLIHPESGDYPLYLYGLQKYAPYTSFVPEMQSEDLLEYGIEVVNMVPRPEGDVVTEGKPVEIKGEWYQSWDIRDFTPEETASMLQNQKNVLLENVEYKRNRFFEEGFPYLFPNGEMYHVQVREGDRTNIAGLRTMAKEAIASGDEVVYEFRTYENISVELTAAQMVDLGNKSFTEVQVGYKAIWNYKDAVKAATTMAALPVMVESIFTPVQPT